MKEPMIPIKKAIEIVDHYAVARQKVEQVGLAASVGRVLAQDIVADMDLPPFDRSQMDGFAVHAADTDDPPASLRIIGESVAGRGFDGRVEPGEAVRIMTGARVPAGANAVQKVESTREADGFVEVLESCPVGQNINRQASETARGEVIIRSGETISAGVIATLASFGVTNPTVARRPRVAIISTGSEIVAPEETPARDQIRNSNSVMLRVYADATGADAIIYPHVDDDRQKLAAAIDEARQNADVVIMTGGVSVGDYDFTKPALRDLGAAFHFEKVALKPGKPTVFASLGTTLFFGLPGNPVSAAVTFHLFARRAIRGLQGALTRNLRRGTAICATRIKATRERDCLLPVSLETSADGRLMIEMLRFSGSSNFVVMARSSALVFVPQGRNLEAGDQAEILFLSENSSIG